MISKHRLAHDPSAILSLAPGETDNCPNRGGRREHKLPQSPTTTFRPLLVRSSEPPPEPRELPVVFVFDRAGEAGGAEIFDDQQPQRIGGRWRRHTAGRKMR